MLDGAFFYLHSAAHPTSRSGVPPYGLSQPGTCYFGGIMWDQDMWMVAPTALTSPSAGLALASFRSRTLPTAERYADARGFS